MSQLCEYLCMNEKSVETVDSLKGKRVIVVGGGTGIGLALAKLVAKEGADLVIASRSSDKLRIVASEIGSAVHIECVDLTDEASIKLMCERIGEFDHLAITARQTQPPQKFLESDLEIIRKAFEVKFWGQYLLAKHSAAHIRTGGSITFTSGTAAQRCYNGYSSVAAMNAATEALCRNLAVELAPTRINTVSPGFVDTNPPSPERYEFSKRLAGRIPAQRLATQDEIAQAYLFLMKNTYASGTVLVVDGAATC